MEAHYIHNVNKCVLHVTVSGVNTCQTRKSHEKLFAFELQENVGNQAILPCEKDVWEKIIVIQTAANVKTDRLLIFLAT